MHKRQVKVGIIGTGTVGSGTIEILLSKAAGWQSTLGVDVAIGCIAARTDAEIAPYKALGLRCTTSVDELLASPDVDIVVELAGGYDMPRKWVLAALNAGKHVVTANKALLAKYGHEIFALATEKKLHVLFEAAVGGGIPIIRTLQESMVGNRVQKLSCIINGTCNYILTRMTREGLAFADVVKEAQAKGYAEADPTFDVDGIDASHKLAILASLASSKRIDFAAMSVEGIRSIEATDIAFAEELGCVIKLLGIYRDADGRVDARVHPCLIHKDHLLSSVNGVLNAVHLECDNLGPHLQTGAGAGKLPTASAVAADIVAIARDVAAGSTELIAMGWFRIDNTAELVPGSENIGRNYFRFTTRDTRGVLARITGILSEHGISIASILQKEVTDPGHVSIVVVTHACLEKEVLAALAAIDALPDTAEPSRRIRFLD